MYAGMEPLYVCNELYFQKQRDLSEQLRQKQLELDEAKQRAQECSSHIASLQTAVEQKVHLSLVTEPTVYAVSFV